MTRSLSNKLPGDKYERLIDVEVYLDMVRVLTRSQEAYVLNVSKVSL